MTPFLFPLAEVKKHVDKLAGTTLVVRTTAKDFHIMENKTVERQSVIMDSHPTIRFVGGNVRVFKPGVPMDLWVRGKIYFKIHKKLGIFVTEAGESKKCNYRYIFKDRRTS